ncbi:hypothetical protein J2S43_007147 [Catenuloplanes nepalensis]|uniref:DUF4365 domain-containing protein n=1 Tax=Catenuloplanes nepalensis TaxID=587533 RepID=A0ABT9N4J3_9ACTN|nr:DUF4365 domain-containing protein [Catenuloplanes nepalensis]MDP9798635.1 hypothetical protein [Catenuloplanes nepalensis]
MHASVHAGLHGEGFIYALACAAGFTTAKMNLDVDGVDWQIAHPGPKGTVRSPKIECQVKARSAPELRDDCFQLRLDAGGYNKIAGEGFRIPRFLFLVAVPDEISGYAVCTHDAMRLGTAGYWLAMADKPVVPIGEEHPKTIVLSVPRRNLLTVHSLGALLAGDLEGAKS